MYLNFNKREFIKTSLTFLSTFVLTTSLGLNLLNEANSNKDISIFNLILMFSCSSLFFYMMINEFNTRSGWELKPLTEVGLSFVASIILYVILNIISSSLIDSNIYEDKTNNIANVYATAHYYNSTINDKEKYKNVYQFKKDLLDDIVKIEQIEIKAKDKNDVQNIGYTLKDNFKELSFWNILSILVLTDKKLLESYESKIEQRHEVKLEKELKKYTDSVYNKYSNAYKTAKIDFEAQQKLYNTQVNKMNSINFFINRDLKILKDIKDLEKINANKVPNQLNQKSKDFAQVFLAKDKERLVKILYNIKGKNPNGGTCSKHCISNAKKNYERYFLNQYGKPYTYWMVERDKTLTTQLLEEGLKLGLTKGTSLLYQTKSGYMDANKKADYVDPSDSHFSKMASNLYLENKIMGLQGVVLGMDNRGYLFAKLNNDDYTRTESFRKTVVTKFKKQAGYEISFNDIINESSFRERAKKYHHERMQVKVKKPVFDDFLKNYKYQEIVQNALGRLYMPSKSEFIPINLNNKELADKYLKPAIIDNINRIEASINYETAFKTMIYPYIVLVFVSFTFLFWLCYFIANSIIFVLNFIKIEIDTEKQYMKYFRIKDLIVIPIMFVFFIMINNHDLSKSTNNSQLKMVSEKLSERSFFTNIGINGVMFMYPIFMEVEDIKERYYLNFLSDSYDFSNTIYTNHVEM